MFCNPPNIPWYAGLTFAISTIINANKCAYQKDNPYSLCYKNILAMETTYIPEIIALSIGLPSVCMQLYAIQYFVIR